MDEEKTKPKEDDHVIFIDRLTDFPSEREKEEKKDEKSEEK